MAFPRAADRGCVFGLVLRRAAQTPYRIGRLSAALASHAHERALRVSRDRGSGGGIKKLEGRWPA